MLSHLGFSILMSRCQIRELPQRILENLRPLEIYIYINNTLTLICMYIKYNKLYSESSNHSSNRINYFKHSK